MATEALENFMRAKEWATRCGEVQGEADKLRDALEALMWERDRLQDALNAERASMAAARTELAALRKELAAAQQLAAWWKGMAEIADRAADRARRRAARVA